MFIDFSEMSKTQRGDYINGIWAINQFLKNVFSSIYLTEDGMVIPDKLNKLTSGIHYAESKLHNYLPVPEGKHLRLDCNKIYVIIKDFKSSFEGIVYEGDGVYFKVKDNGNIIVGKITKPAQIPKDGYENVETVAVSLTKFKDDEIELMCDKKILEKNYKEYSMLLAHKLFPNLKKCEDNVISIYDYHDSYFVTDFALSYKAANSSGKKVYSELYIHHKYKFIKI